MVLFKCREASPLDKFFRFYIPIWFYSNAWIKHDKDVDSDFTFQYGSIQILCDY